MTVPETETVPAPVAQGSSPAKQWYENVWVTFLAGYVFAPLGLYLMWRYQDWPLWLKTGLTAFGVVAMVVGTYVSSRYVMPHLM